MAVKKRGAPENIGETHKFQVTIAQEQFDFLTLLAGISRYGANENDVAAYVLTRELDRMFKAGEHKETVPKRRH